MIFGFCGVGDELVYIYQHLLKHALIITSITTMLHILMPFSFFFFLSIFHLDLFPHPRSSTNTIFLCLTLPFRPWADCCCPSRCCCCRCCRLGQRFGLPSTSITNDDDLFVFISTPTPTVVQDTPINRIIHHTLILVLVLVLEIFRSEKSGRCVKGFEEGGKVRTKWGDG